MRSARSWATSGTAGGVRQRSAPPGFPSELGGSAQQVVKHVSAMAHSRLGSSSSTSMSLSPRSKGAYDHRSVGVGLGAGVGGLSVWVGIVTGATWWAAEGELRRDRGCACLVDCWYLAPAFRVDAEAGAGPELEPTAELEAESGGDWAMAGGDGGQRMPGH